MIQKEEGDMNLYRIGTVIFLVCIALNIGSLNAQTETVILPANGEKDEGFGMRIDVYGDYLIVGAPNNDVYGTSAGKAYIYKQIDGQWVEQQELFAHDAQAYDYFGNSVAITSSMACVSAMGLQRDSTNAGAVYVFDKIGDDWLLHSKLTPPGLQPGAYYGYRMDFNGDYLFISAHGTGMTNGCVYALERNGSSWYFRQALQPADNAARDQFGRSLATAGSWLAVGAMARDDDTDRTGAVYLYRYNNGSWEEWGIVLPPEQQENLYFGKSLDLRYSESGTLHLAVTSDDPAKGEQAGQVYVYRYDGDFVLEKQMTSGQGQTMDRFGCDVALGDDFLAVGVDHFSAWHDYQGAAYLYRQAGQSWYGCGNFVDRHPMEMGLFGVSVAMNNDYLFVGKQFTALGKGAGLVMAYRLNTEPIITKCIDVPYDQGGAVQILWDASFPDIGQQISHYSVWRALPNGAAAKLAVDQGGEIRSTIENGSTYNWEWVSDTPAHHYASYMAAIPTLYDSMSTTSGLHYFLVSAHHPNGTTFIDSEVDSAYSVDNLAPPPPGGLNGEAVGDIVHLSWEASPAADVKGYQVYRNGEVLHFMAETAWQDPDAADLTSVVYSISAVDIHENEGARCPEVEVVLTGVEESSMAQPDKLALLPNYPNPFNPQTTVAFDMPQSAHVRLTVFDVKGREIAVLKDDVAGAGRHRIIFNAVHLPSGIYTFHLKTGNVLLCRKMLYLK
ncbi:T9SS type A sorting domain-containing protein [bacterium]|nr:T9SS type A sorting domain-containing protein [bacterium]